MFPLKDVFTKVFTHNYTNLEHLVKYAPGDGAAAGATPWRDWPGGAEGGSAAAAGRPAPPVPPSTSGARTGGHLGDCSHCCCCW